jgi:hypothetical protein
MKKNEMRNPEGGNLSFSQTITATGFSTFPPPDHAGAQA